MKRYIDEKYVIVTTENVSNKIKRICPWARVFTVDDDIRELRDEWGINKFLIDRYFMSREFVNKLKSDPKNTVVEWHATKKEIEKLEDEINKNKSCAPSGLSSCKSVNEFERAFDTVKKVVEETNLDITDTEIGHMLFCLARENIISRGD